MWTCVKCQHENTDRSTACEGCGAARSAGRFASGSRPTQGPLPQGASQMPVVTAARPTRVEQPPLTRPEPSREQPVSRTPYANAAPRPRRQDAPDMETRPVSRRGAVTVLIGGMLCVLLPLVCALIAWRQYGALSPVLLSLFFAEDAALPDILKTTIYAVLTLVAVLVSLIPGLWTVAFGRMSARRK